VNASHEWLAAFAPTGLDPAGVRDALTARVATVDDLVPLRADLAGIVVARVLEAAPHPDSDHLWVTRVDVGGSEMLDVVCGAPNVVAGALYPFAPVGAVLPGGLRIERRRIRGATSNGMLCSARELGLGTDHAGIMELVTDHKPGARFLDAFPAGDVRFVVDVLPNRPDLLSHEGLGRELAAHAGVPLRRPPELEVAPVSLEFVVAADRVADTPAPVRVVAGAGCERYIGVVIRGVTVRASPDWLVQRLQAIGSRSINNVVDATNYMLHAFGHPMHAFDLGRLAGGEIVVRESRPAERIRTLDGVERALPHGTTVIADAERAQAVAGVIGGAESEVTEATRDVLLEVAVFDPRAVRRARRALGISTDASYRFERGVDALQAERRALDATALIIALAGGTAERRAASVGAPPVPPACVPLRVSRIATVLGEPLPAAHCAALLETIGFVVSAGNGVLHVTPPSWRRDVREEADVLEEVARLHGYDAFSDVLRPFRVGTTGDAAAHTVTARVRDALIQAGLYEVRPIPFVADAGPGGVRLRNPLADSEAMLRQDLLSTLVPRAEYNFARHERDVRLFEIGVAFSARVDSPVPQERTLAAAVITGDRFPAHFTEPRPPQVDLWDARWLAEVTARAAYGAGRVELRPRPEGEQWDILVDGVARGHAGPLTVDAPVWARPVFGIELDLTAAFSERTPQPRFHALPTTPAAEFDLALVVPATVTASDVDGCIRRAAGELLEQLVPFDEFRGAGLPEGTRSVAWRLTLRHSERTLRDKEIEGRRARILRALDEELGVRPRAS